MNAFNQDELKLIGQALNAYQTDDVNGDEDVEDYHVVRTHETTDDFKNAGNWSGIMRGFDTGDGWTSDFIDGYQSKKGEQRRDLLVVDLGHVRAVIEF